MSNATLSTSGVFPPLEFRSVAILFTFTLNLIIIAWICDPKVATKSANSPGLILSEVLCRAATLSTYPNDLRSAAPAPKESYGLRFQACYLNPVTYQLLNELNFCKVMALYN